MTTTILFDLDGTLLPMDQETFVKAYFDGLARKAVPHGYEPKQLINIIWAGTAAMTQNNGDCTNEEVFWSRFARAFGEESLADRALFDSFYEKEFHEVQKVCGYNPAVPALIHDLQGAGIRLVLATNPIFPRVATYARIRWAGLAPEDFSFITTYENSRRCKPNPAYYSDLLSMLSLDPAVCIMVGNDVDEDMVAETLGMRVFLLTDCLINSSGADIARYPHGDVAALRAYLQTQL